MSISQIIELIFNTISSDGGRWIAVVIVMLSLIQISPIKLDPWTAMFKWIGSKLNAGVNTKLEDMDKKIDGVDKKLNEHIIESEHKDIRRVRSDILSFGSSLISGKNFNKEHFDFMINECDNYEKYCHDKGIKNGVADATIKEIRRVYSAKLAEGGFLKEASHGD